MRLFPSRGKKPDRPSKYARVAAHPGAVQAESKNVGLKLRANPGKSRSCWSKLAKKNSLSRWIGPPRLTPNCWRRSSGLVGVKGSRDWKASSRRK
jgi:hypothetical protein